MESGSTEDDDDNVDKEYDYFNADIILENEEEYDILNDETFGDNLTGYLRLLRRVFVHEGSFYSDYSLQVLPTKTKI